MISCCRAVPWGSPARFNKNSVTYYVGGQIAKLVKGPPWSVGLLAKYLPVLKHFLKLHSELNSCIPNIMQTESQFRTEIKTNIWAIKTIWVILALWHYDIMILALCHYGIAIIFVFFLCISLRFNQGNGFKLYWEKSSSCRSLRYLILQTSLRTITPTPHHHIHALNHN